jgi:AGZA family xanthine/uracil permease-like MFS transporter
MAVFIEGLIFIVLSLTNVREAIFNAIPSMLKKGVSAGIGLFVAFIGLQGAYIVVPNGSTIISYVNFRENWHTMGICAVLALVGLMITAILYYKGVMGAILIGIVATWVLGMIMQACGVYVPDAEAGFYSLYPSFALTDFSKLGETFGQCFQADFSNVSVLNFIVVIFSFLFVDMFDTIGTLIGVSTKAGFLDKEEKLPRVKQALLADAIATSVGAVLGTSTTTTFVESSAGVGAGGRTGLTSVVTGLLFILAIFFAPIFTAIPGFATAPALIFVGFLMLSIIVKIEFEDFREAVPAYLTILCMPLMYSIAEGIAIGVVSYVVINVVCNLVSDEKKKITPLMYVLAVLFVCKYIFL